MSQNEASESLQQKRPGIPNEPLPPQQPEKSGYHNISRVPPEHPIEYWQERLVGRKLIDDDAVGDDTVSRRHLHLNAQPRGSETRLISRNQISLTSGRMHGVRRAGFDSQTGL